MAILHCICTGTCIFIIAFVAMGTTLLKNYYPPLFAEIGSSTEGMGVGIRQADMDVGGLQT